MLAKSSVYYQTYDKIIKKVPIQYRFTLFEDVKCIVGPILNSIHYQMEK